MPKPKIIDEAIKTFPVAIGKGGKVTIPKSVRDILELKHQQVVVIQIVSYSAHLKVSAPLTSTMIH